MERQRRRDRLSWQLDRNVVKFGNIGSYREVDAHFGGLGPLVIILFEAPPHLASLHSNHRVVAGGVISRTVEQIRPNAALLQRIIMPFQLMLYDIGEKLLTAAAVPKRRAGEDVFQFLKNCRFVHPCDDRRARFWGIHIRD
jgi:hypothetical protein